MKTRSAILCASTGLGLATCAHASVIDFESLDNGAIVTNQFAAAPDYITISAINPNRSHDLAAIFNSNIKSSADPDLNGGPWSRGNIADTDLGNLLIISERSESARRPGFVRGPDDEGSRPGGSITLAYSLPFRIFQADIIDIESVILESSSFEFYENGLLGAKAVVDFADFVDTDSPFYDPTIVFGNRSANRIRPITAASLGLDSFDTVIIRVGGSSAFDNINASDFVPAPGATALFGAVGLTTLRRRRR